MASACQTTSSKRSQHCQLPHSVPDPAVHHDNHDTTHGTPTTPSHSNKAFLLWLGSGGTGSCSVARQRTHET
eukprot:2298465-Rhodomonas_salina.2